MPEAVISTGVVEPQSILGDDGDTEIFVARGTSNEMLLEQLPVLTV